MQIGTVLVTGPGADDVEPMISRYGPGESDVITPYAGIKALLGDRATVLHAKGADFHDARFPGPISCRSPRMRTSRPSWIRPSPWPSRRMSSLRWSGDDHSTVGESRSRTSLDLPGHQLLLVQGDGRRLASPWWWC